MRKIPEEIKMKIRRELDRKISDPAVAQATSEIERNLVEPFLQTCLDVLSKREIDLYVVFKEHEESDSLDRFWIVYSLENKMFGLALISKTDKHPEFLGFDGSFIDAFFGR
jgi:hypothetical protein